VERQWCMDMEETEDIEGEAEGRSTSMPDMPGLSERHIVFRSSPLTLPAGVLMFMGSLPLGMG